MREFELETWNLYQEERSIAASCWHCNEGWNKGKLLISPCKCTDQFIHIHCLEISANTENVIHCQFCSARYPLEIKQKSLLECYRDSTLLQLLREVRAPLFIVLFFMFSYLIFIVTFIYYLYVIILFDYMWQHKIFIFMHNFYLWSSLFYIYNTMPYVIKFSNRIREIYHQWIKSTQEFKLMEQYPNNIQVISV
ncbi:E3 ubiquitin-protein ligase MARCHF2-like [Cataglyphis hispanica]|uniref:E3 ubiquitin-protein ligase MARCHF2-like n=1 Tax=Cataglyphis hispanica TaxID=1086592 RepID=UPI00217F2CD8|nr:E3 ubiquitin-protein ligase MARCHF2-like [Cataglyphis hispanica]XP_050445684.1 E3 ubiquitin-protein ligase MARCHF2-like [Cataglyphis hispanica]XP_050445685.1 E3 ubiquitin-protein ligase MARCHF2-like [Cataglyphis hispanica]